MNSCVLLPRDLAQWGQIESVFTQRRKHGDISSHQDSVLDLRLFACQWAKSIGLGGSWPEHLWGACHPQLA